jgi:hypothetical protein
MYLSGRGPTQDLELLKEVGVTHILNLAADVCENCFPEEFCYKSYHLKDSRTQVSISTLGITSKTILLTRKNIECVFYDCIEFMENCRTNGGKVLIHCEKGVSRSSTLVIAYLM